MLIANSAVGLPALSVKCSIEIDLKLDLNLGFN